MDSDSTRAHARPGAALLLRVGRPRRAVWSLTDHERVWRQVLRFYCVWDDRSALYGDRRPYRLHAFPDGSMEILETRDANSGRDPFPVFLRRGLLPKAGHL